MNQLRKPSLAVAQLDRIFDKWWPDLDSGYTRALEEEPKDLGHPAAARDDRQLLEEILLRVREFGLSESRGRALERSKGSDVLSRSLNLDSLAWYTLWKFPGTPIKDRLQVTLLKDLDLQQYPRIADLDEVVDLAHDAVAAYAEEKPELFRFGTDYITKSLGFVDLEFRARHRFSSQTREAFERLEDLVVEPES